MGRDEYKCECNDGYDGKICEFKCDLDCGINGICANEFDSTTGTKQWKCICTNNFTGLIENNRY